MQTKSSLYFIHSIDQLFEDDGSLIDDIFNLVLFPVKSYKISVDSDNQIPNSEIYQVNSDIIQGFEEGSFVYIKKKDDGSITELFHANADKLARQLIMMNNGLRYTLLQKRTESEKSLIQMEMDTNIYSYHVNVGHGNCCFIAFTDKRNVRLWCIDCSEYEHFGRRSYRTNIEACFQCIKRDFKINTIKIDKFFLTHSHYDHYNGMFNLLKNYRSSNSEFWINIYYSYPYSIYNNLLSLIYSFSDVKVVDAYPWNSTPNIRILNPNEVILRTKSKRKKVSKGIQKLVSEGHLTSPSDIVIQTEANNASILYQFKFGNKSILFPGDIEEKGWENILACPTFLSDSTYYCVSHHGSINGHIRKKCPCGFHINNVLPCSQQSRIIIISARDGAYHGIINKKLLSDYYSSHMNSVYRTDKKNGDMRDPKFFRINWSTDRVDYYF